MSKGTVFATVFCLLVVFLSGVSANSHLADDWEIIGGASAVTCEGELPEAVLTKAEESLVNEFGSVTIDTYKKNRCIFEYQDLSVASKKGENCKGTFKMKRILHPFKLYNNVLVLRIRAQVTEQPPDKLLVEASITGRGRGSDELFNCTFHYTRT